MLSKSKAKYIQSLGQKKHRDIEERFIAEGPKVVKEFLNAAPSLVDEVYATKEWLTSEGQHFPSTSFIEVTEEELERISQLKTANSVLAVVRMLPGADIEVKGKIILALDTIQDPGNLGTILRIADWFDISQIICSHECADRYNPKVVQASMGSLARINVVYTNLGEWLEQNEEAEIFAMMLDGRNLNDVAPIKEGIILVGNESKGLNPQLAALAKVKITIPRRGKAESLNAAVAVGIVLARLTA